MGLFLEKKVVNKDFNSFQEIQQNAGKFKNLISKFKYLRLVKKVNPAHEAEIKKNKRKEKKDRIVSKKIFYEKIKVDIPVKETNFKVLKKSLFQETRLIQVPIKEKKKFFKFKKTPKLFMGQLSDAANSTREYSEDAKKLFMTKALRTANNYFSYEKKPKTPSAFKSEIISTSTNRVKILSGILAFIFVSAFIVSNNVFNPLLKKQRSNIQIQSTLSDEITLFGYQIPSLDKKINELDTKIKNFDQKTIELNNLDKLYAAFTSASLDYDVIMYFDEIGSRFLKTSEKNDPLYKVVNVVLTIESTYLNYLKFRYNALVESELNVRIISEEILPNNNTSSESELDETILQNDMELLDYDTENKENLFIKLNFEVIERLES